MIVGRKNKKHRYPTLNRAVDTGVLMREKLLCAYIEIWTSENAEISTWKWSSLCTKPLQKMEFIGSSRQKFQKHRLQNYKQKPPKNAFFVAFFGGFLTIQLTYKPKPVIPTRWCPRAWESNPSAHG